MEGLWTCEGHYDSCTVEPMARTHWTWTRQLRNWMLGCTPCCAAVGSTSRNLWYLCQKWKLSARKAYHQCSGKLAVFIWNGYPRWPWVIVPPAQSPTWMMSRQTSQHWSCTMVVRLCSQMPLAKGQRLKRSCIMVVPQLSGRLTLVDPDPKTKCTSLFSVF